jgi:hypothetical protein
MAKFSKFNPLQKLKTHLATPTAGETYINIRLKKSDLRWDRVKFLFNRQVAMLGL